MTKPPPTGQPERKTIDLDAARKARREKKAPAPNIIFMGVSYQLPPELPAETVHAFGALAMHDYAGLGAGMEALFGGQWDPMVKAAAEAGDPFSFEDEIFLLEQAFDAYGMELPESLASGPS